MTSGTGGPVADEKRTRQKSILFFGVISWTGHEVGRLMGGNKIFLLVMTSGTNGSWTSRGGKTL